MLNMSFKCYCNKPGAAFKGEVKFMNENLCLCPRTRNQRICVSEHTEITQASALI